MNDADLLNAYRGVIDLARSGVKVLVLLPEGGCERLRVVDLDPVEEDFVVWETPAYHGGRAESVIRYWMNDGCSRVVDLRKL